MPLKNAFHYIVNKDRELHEWITGRLPRALPAIDSFLELLFSVVTNGAFSVIVAFLLVVLAATNVINKIVAVSIAGAWLVALVWIARSKSLKSLTILSRWVLVSGIGIVLGVAGNDFGSWAMKQYNQQKLSERNIQPTDEKPSAKPSEIEPESAPDISEKKAPPPVRRAADLISPIDELSKLGWMVQPETGTSLRFSDIYKHISMQASAKYFCAINRPFSVDIVGATSLDGVAGLRDAASLTKLSLSAPEVSDLSELRYLRNLDGLVISQATAISDLSALQGLTKLKELTLGSTAIRDLTQIQGLKNITTLSIGGTQVSDLSPIRNFSNLRVLGLGGSRVTDLSSVSDIKSLEELSVSGQQVPGLPVLRYLNVKKLYLAENAPVDLSSVGELGTLEILDITGPQMLNLSPLRRLARLTNLKLMPEAFESLMQVEDIEAIGELHELRKLVLFQVLIPNLSFMRGLNNLTEFTAINTPISEIAGIELAASLNTVQFTNTRVVEISPLLNLPNLKELYVIRTPARSDVLTILEQRGIKVHR